MSRKKILITAVFGLLCFAIAEAQTRRQIHDTIPFEIVYDKFIFQAKIDGKPLRLILDTGGINALVADSAEYFGFTAISTQRIADANDAVMLTQMGSVQNFRIGRYMNWSTGRMTLIPNHQFLRDLGVAGTVGGEFFAQVCLTIDKRNRHFIISAPFRPSGISRSDGTPMEMGSTFHAVVPVSFGGEEINVLFDTGKSGFLNMSAADFERLNRAGSAEKEYIGSGILFVGATGFDNAISDEIIKALVPEITLPGGKQLLNVGTTVSQTTTTIFGQQLLDFGVMMLDYPRGLFYFFPYEEYRDVATDVAEMTRVWNTRILPVHDSFRVVATIGEVDTEIGDRVWSINGTPLTLDNFSEMFVLELLGKAENGMAEIMIGEYENQLRKVTIKRI
jgi:hypothetical protein